MSLHNVSRKTGNISHPSQGRFGRRLQASERRPLRTSPPPEDRFCRIVSAPPFRYEWLSTRTTPAADINFWVDSRSYNIVECTHMILLAGIVDLLIGSSEYGVTG